MIARIRLGPVCLAALATAACAHLPDRGPSIAHGCNDLVVDGTIVTHSQAGTSVPDDLLGHGQYPGTLFITKVLRGKAGGLHLT